MEGGVPCRGGGSCVAFGASSVSLLRGLSLDDMPDLMFFIVAKWEIVWENAYLCIKIGLPSRL